MSTQTIIQAAIVRLDLALCAIGRAIVSIVPGIIAFIMIYALWGILWRDAYGHRKTRRH